MSVLVQFIKENKEWASILKKKPYSLQISNKDNLYLFKYNQVESDFSIPLVNEARGIILEIIEEDVKIVCYPFKKFFNYGESHAAPIDFASASIQEKIDGSILKLFYYNGWKLATNGAIDAFENASPLNVDYSFGDLFNEASKNILNYGLLNKDYTYMFELVSKWNRIVVPYTETKIYHIGTRNNVTEEELNVDIGIAKPKQYKMASLEEVIETAKALPFSEEGYVVVDKYWNRVKIKSPQYLAVHKLKGQSGILNMDSLLKLVKENETEEFLTYFPEYKQEVEHMKALWENF
jgi:T4 RnlA family RNA ligase